MRFLPYFFLPLAKSVFGALPYFLNALQKTAEIDPNRAETFFSRCLDATDPFKCGALMNQGQWLDPGRARYSRAPYQIWQPPGCLMHEYKKQELIACLKSKRLVFIGDSTTRQIFWATAKKLDEGGAIDDMSVARKHADLIFTRDGVGLEFIWDPYLNSSRLYEELEAYKNPSHSSTEKGGEQTGSAALILVGGGLWFARHVPINTLKVFRDSVDKIIPYMNPPVAAPPKVVPRPFVQDRESDNLLLMTPVQVPQYDLLSPSRSETITSEKIDAMNGYLQHLSAFQEADVVWSFSFMTWRQRAAYEQSGLHVVDNVAGRKADVLLNLRCNAEAAVGIGGQGYPYDRTCCSNYHRLGWVQWTGLFGALVILPFLVWITRTDRKRIRLLPSGKVLRALLVFSLAVVYCFYADRTHVFEKIHKQRSTKEFVVLSGVSLSLGLLSIRRSTSPPTSSSREQRALDQPFLSRHQTDEWKGWMQFVILIYHYAGVSKILWIYVTIRLLVASYLFMTGFGHAVYFYKEGDYSLRRVTGVLIRLNLLNCVLPYVMRTDYLFYYFAPLVSFWFIVVYVTMWIGHSRNDSLPFISSKIVISAVLVAAFTKLHGPLEAAFAVISYTCRLHWDVGEWRFRASLDMFIVYIGMIVAILFVRVSVSPGSQWVEAMLKHRYLQLALLSISFVILYTFAAIARRFPDKYDYNQWHPYISFLPIVAFTIIRNSHRHLRNFYSPVFAWLGRCSLETFTLQFHIWMAGDTKGLLSLGTFRNWSEGRWYSFAVVTAVFLYISWRVARVTEVLTQWIIRGEERRSGGQDGLLMEKDGHDEQRGKLELPLRKSHDSGRRPMATAGGTNCSEASKWEIGRTIVMRWKWLLVRLWRCEDLIVRLGVLTVAMWFLNVIPEALPLTTADDSSHSRSHRRSKSSLALSLLHRERSREDREDKHNTAGSSSSTVVAPHTSEKAASIEQSVRTFRLFESLRSGDTAAISKAIKESASTAGSGQAGPGQAGQLEGTTLLHLAIRCVELPVLEYILSVATTTPGVSIDVNARDKDGNTPLHLAAQLGRSQIVHLLLEQKDINDSIMNYQGRAPIDLARNPDIFQQLQLARSIFLDGKVQEVHDLVGRNDYVGLEKLLDDPRVQNVLDVNGGELVTDPNTSLTAGTLLHEAARKKDTRLIQILLLHGADPFRRDRKGKLPQDVTKDERTRGVLKRSPAAAAAQRGIQEKAVLGSSVGAASTILGGAPGEAALTSKEGREMKGYLKKWTNYTSGYKLRWFVLEDGVLNDAGSACRGAIHMRIAKLNMDPQDKQRFEILGKSSVKYHLKANHVVEAKRWFWALNNAIQWAKDEAKEEEKQKLKNTEQLQQAKIDQAEKASHRDKSDSAGESASISSARQGNRNGKTLIPGSSLHPIPPHVAVAGTSTGPASITDEDNGTAYSSYEPSVYRAPNNIGTTTIEVDVDEDEEYGDDVSSREVQPTSKDAFNITAQSAKLQLDLLADISTALHAERNRNPNITISNAVIVSAMRSYESAVESLKGLVGDLLKISRDRDAYWQYRLDREADVRRMWEDSMARVVKEQEALEGKIGESEDKRKRTKRALRDVLESGSAVTFDSRPTSRDAEDGEQVAQALEKSVLGQNGASLQSPSALSRRKSRVEQVTGISDSEEEDDEEFFDAIDAGELEVISEMPSSPPPEVIKEARSTLGIRELKKTEIESSFIGYEDGPRRRLKLDADERPKISLWGILKSMIGKDMTKMTLPVSFNEPTSLLQRVAEDMEYTDLLDTAADRPDSTERMVYVAAFAASEYSSTTGRVAKPFNPLLGETYEYARPDKGYRFFIEQVSHHPPIGAAFAESPRWDYYGESAVKSKFYGKSFDINPLGTWFLKLRPITGGEELYTWKKVTSSVVGIITGAPTVDNYGPMEVKNWTTGEVCNLDFKQRGWRAAGAYEVKGRVLDSNGSQRWSIGGHWNDKIYARLTPGYDASVTAPDNSSIRSGGSGGATQAFLVWQSNLRPSGIPFNLTPFVVTLNAIPDSLRKVVCPTDTRLRPDQRAMEDGEYDFAAVEKNRLEEKQRATRREREGKGEAFMPKWFTKGRCGVTGEEYWMFNGEYWKMREGVTHGGEWKGVEDIF